MFRTKQSADQGQVVKMVNLKKEINSSRISIKNMEGSKNLSESRCATYQIIIMRSRWHYFRFFTVCTGVLQVYFYAACQPK